MGMWGAIVVNFVKQYLLAWKFITCLENRSQGYFWKIESRVGGQGICYGISIVLVIHSVDRSGFAIALTIRSVDRYPLA